MRVERMRLLSGGLLSFFLLLPWAAQAQVYKCVDERGRTNYADKPGPGCKASAIEVRPQPPASEKAGSARGKGQAASRPPPPQQVRAQDTRTLAQRCASMRNELVRLASRQRVASVGEKGEVKYREDPTRDTRLAQLQQEMRACP
jgi:Domain of unknown function (DUF4124)